MSRRNSAGHDHFRSHHSPVSRASRLRGTRLILGVEKSNEIDEDTEIHEEVASVGYVEVVEEVRRMIGFQPAGRSAFKSIRDDVRDDPHG